MDFHVYLVAYDSHMIVLLQAPTEKKQKIQLDPGQKYFKAQFLLKISHQVMREGIRFISKFTFQKTRILANVFFTDATTKKEWRIDDSDTFSALTVELVDAASNATAMASNATATNNAATSQGDM